MMDKCFDEGTIQAFLDGELGNEMIDQVSNHVEMCDSCALAIAEAEQESVHVFAALEHEFDTLVPTQRLWAKINDTIEDEASKRGFWQTIYAFLSNPMAASFASLLIVFGLFAGVVTFIDNQNSTLISMNPTEDMEVYNPSLITEEELTFPDEAPAIQADLATDNGDGGETETLRPSFEIAKTNKAPKVFNTSYDGKGRSGSRKQTKVNKPVQNQEVVDSDDAQIQRIAYLPGEGTYERTISTLEEKVNVRKDFVLTGSDRFSYEKDIAVADDAINKMKQEVKKNPKNNAARDVLLTAYQNKIDLLTAVSEKTELLASLD